MQVIDVSMPIDAGHIRWPVERGKRGDYAQGDLFEASRPCIAPRGEVGGEREPVAGWGGRARV